MPVPRLMPTPLMLIRKFTNAGKIHWSISPALGSRERCDPWRISFAYGKRTEGIGNRELGWGNLTGLFQNYFRVRIYQTVRRSQSGWGKLNLPDQYHKPQHIENSRE